MTTTIQARKKSSFLILPQHIKKEVIVLDEGSQPMEIDLDHVKASIEHGKARSIYGPDNSFKNNWSTSNHITSNLTISIKEDIFTSKNVDIKPNRKSNGKIGGNNIMINTNLNPMKGDPCDSDEEEITKEDVEAIHEQLTKANAILDGQLTELKTELNQVRCSSIVNKQINLRKEIGQLTCQKQKFLNQNGLLKSLCFGNFTKRFHANVKHNIEIIERSLKADLNYIVQSKSQLETAVADRGSEFKSSKSAQTIKTMTGRVNDCNKSEKPRNDLILQLKHRNLELIQRLDQAKSPSLAYGPSLMLIKRDEYLKLLQSCKSPKPTANRTNLPKTNSVIKISKPQTIKPKQQQKSPSIPVQVEVPNKKEIPTAAAVADPKRQFYTCKCGQQFSKNALGYKAAYDSFRQHVAKCSVYMKNGAVCDICDAPFHSIPCLKVHIRRIHPERPELLEKYRHVVSCPCGKVFDNYSQECTAIKALRKHARNCPSYRSKAIFCYICKEPFLEPNQLNNHIRMAHAKTNGVNGKTAETASKASTVKKRKVT